MKRQDTVWGALLVVLGLVFLLNQLGILRVSVWAVFVPLLLIGAGLWVLLTAGRGASVGEREEISIPLEGTTEARVDLKQGAGKLQVLAGAAGDALLSGSFVGGVVSRVEREGERVRVKLKVPDEALPRAVLPWNWGSATGLEWRVMLNREVPLDLRLFVGANEAELDLSDLQVTNLLVETGMSSTHLILPSQAGHTRASVKGGLASTAIEIPEGVAARIKAQGGLSSVRIHGQRFERRGSYYESFDYGTAPNRVDLVVEVGVGSVDVR
ncbi:MAG: LiaI-LiaF-like domain-containing protein [Anaerolineae bacterium]